MRLATGLFLLAACTTFAAPQKEKFPVGVIDRLTVAESGKKDDAASTVHVLTFVDDKNLLVGTGAGWATWDLEKRQRRQDKLAGGPAFALARDEDRLFIGTARKLHAIEPIQSEILEPARSWDSKSADVAVLAVAPGGRRIAYSDGEQHLAVVDTKTGKATGSIELASRPAAACLTANGRIIAVATRDGAVRVYNLAPTGAVEPLWAKRVARADRIAAAFSPDGRLLAVTSAGRVMLLDSVTGQPLQRLERRFGEGDVRCLAFSPDSKYIAYGTGGPEPAVRVSDVVTGNEIATGSGHSGDVNGVAFSPDSRVVASGGTDGTVMLWRVYFPNRTPKAMTTVDAWESLDSLETNVAYESMGCLLAHPGRAVTVIGEGFRGAADEQARIRRWITELDHDEFRTREGARRNLLKTGLRGAAALTEPGRKKMGPEGEQRVRLILEALDSQGLHVPESGLFGELLRSIRGVRVLETIGGKAAREVLEEAAKGPDGLRLTRDAKLALETFRDGR